MKLLFCKDCQDIIRLIDTKRTCRCGKVSGKYIDNIHVVYSGDNAVPIGFANSTLRNAVLNQPIQGMGKEFIAFVMPKITKNIKKVDNF